MVQCQRWVDVNLKKQTTTKINNLVSGDTENVIIVRLFDGDDAVVLDENTAVVAVFTRADGKVFTQDSRVEGSGVVTAVSTVTISLKPSSFSAGKNHCEIEIYSRADENSEFDSLITTASFEVFARVRAASAEAVESSDQFPYLLELIEDERQFFEQQAQILREAVESAQALLSQFPTVSTEITAQSTDAEVPSARAVHIAIQNGTVISVNSKTGTVTLYPSDIGYQSVYGGEQLFNVGDALDAYGNDLQKLLNDAVFERVNGGYKAKDDIDMDGYYIRNAYFDVLSIDGDGYIYAVPTDDGHIANKKYVDDAIAAAIGNIDTLLGSGVIE